MNEINLPSLEELIEITTSAYFCIDTTNLKCLYYYSKLPWELAVDRYEMVYKGGGFLKSIFSEDKVNLLSFIDSTPENSPASYDFRVLDENSQIHWVRFLFKKYQTSEKKLCIGVLLEISTEKNKIHELENKFQQIEKIFYSGFDSFYFLIPYYSEDQSIVDFKIQEINDFAIKQLGYTREELVGKLICKILPSNLKDVFFQKYIEAFSQKKVIYQKFEITNDYTFPSWYEQQIFPLNKGIAVFNRRLSPYEKQESSLQETLWHLEAFNSTFPGIFFIFNSENNQVIYINKNVKTILGYNSWIIFESGIQFFFDLVHPQEKEKVKAEYDLVLKNYSTQDTPNQVFTLEFKILSSSGEWKYLKSFINKFPVNGNKNLFLFIAIDITDEKITKENLYKNEIQLATLLSNIPDMVARFDIDFNCIYVNKSTCKIFNISENEVLKKNLIDFPFATKVLSLLIEAFQIVKTTIQIYELIIQLEVKSEQRYFQIKLIPEKYKDNELENILLISWDITEIKKSEKELFNTVFFDSTTNLPNRKFFLEKLENQISKSTNNNSFGIMFIDIDRFKEVNENLGHILADTLLKEVSKRIQIALPKDITLSRIGGDEFSCIVSQNSQNIKTYLASLSLDIMQQFSEPIKIEDHEIYTSVSIGIAIYPSDGTDTQTLLKNAEKAANYIQQRDHNSFVFYTSNIGNELARKREIVQLLRKSLKEQEDFELFYQPKVDFVQKKIIGAEALIRWKNKQYSSPEIFIPVAEESGLIIPLGEWVIQRAIKDIVQLKKLGYSNIPIAVNLSTHQFEIPKIHKFIFDLLTLNKIETSLFEIEITEGVAMKNVLQSQAILRELSLGGIKISIDDFGTGYSSLSYLKKFPIDYLKIDKTFIRDIPENSESCAIVSAVISMAQDLDISIIAEGVENNEQLEFLLSKNCSIMQGFLFSKPLAFVDFINYINNFNTFRIKE